MTAEHAAPAPAPNQHHVNGGLAEALVTDTNELAAFEAWRAQQRAIAAGVRQADDAEAVSGEITKRVTLPSGGWAELKDPRSVRTKHRRRALDSMNIERLQAGTAGVSLDMLDGLILMMVERWEIPYLPGIASPVQQPSCLDEMELPDYDALSDYMEPARKLLFPQPASIDDTKPGSPTRPGGA